jgi:MYXO-CTERM domain-containing protein
MVARPQQSPERRRMCAAQRQRPAPDADVAPGPDKACPGGGRAWRWRRGRGTGLASWAAMTPTLRLASAGLIGLASIAALARPGRACSPPVPPPQGYSSRQTLPEDGATGVPSNARISVSYATQRIAALEYIDPHLELRDSSGNVVPARFASLRQNGSLLETLTPDDPLVAGTYQILDLLSATCDTDQISQCRSTEPTVIGSFTASDTADTATPTFAGATGVEATYHPFHHFSDCGGNDAYLLYGVQWAAATDDRSTSWLRYNVYNDRDELQGVAAAPPVTIYTGCSNYLGDPVTPVDPTQRTFYVRAVDIAGNEDANRLLVVGATCEEAAPPEPEEQDEDDGGCNAAGAGPGAATGALGAMPLLIAGLALRGRRRRGPAR